MLENLFTSRTRVRLLQLLLFNQDRAFHLRELARLIDASAVHVSRELDKLRKLNLVEKARQANLTLYSLNKGCVILEELRRLFMKTDYLGEIIRKELEGKAKYCLIFGSFAGGTETKNSDIDLLVISGIKEDSFVSILEKSEKLTGREINYILWDEKTFGQRAKGHHLLRTIKRWPVIMLIGDEDEFRQSIT